MDKELLASVYDMSREELLGVLIALMKDIPIGEAIDQVRGKKKKGVRHPKTGPLFPQLNK